MRSALYYPHTQIQSEGLLKTSLLMWDQLEFIVPHPSYRPYYSNPLFERAIELIGVQRYPSEQDKRQAHDVIEDLATSPLPEAFFYRGDGHENYEIYPQKLMPETWRILSDLDIAGQPLRNADYPLTETGGLSVMAILADCCAGTTRARVTDRGLAYATITNLTLDRATRAEADLYERVVPLTLSVIDSSSIPLERLIRFREREQKPSGYTLRDLRHRYVSAIEAHVKAVEGVKNRADREELDRAFKGDIKDDLKNLCAELQGAKTDAFFSKELITSVVVAGATVLGAAHGLPFEIPAAFTAMGAPVTVGGLLTTKNKYSNSRRSIMQEHPMAYLYELSQLR